MIKASGAELPTGQPGADRDRRAHSPSQNLHVHRVLIVDDMKTIRSLLQVYLMGQGFEFIEADNAQGALQVLRLHKPDLIICDVKMADVDGFELCAAIKKDPEISKIPLIHISSSWQDPEFARRSRQAGACHLIGKPVDPERLKKVVWGCLS